jgi:5-methylcytosine-specific restriction endonuclease McrA
MDSQSAPRPPRRRGYMPKTEYDISGRRFHVERCSEGWIGWFIDSPEKQFTGPLKRKVLTQAGYRPPDPGGIRLVVDATDGVVEYGPPRTMQTAYEEFRRRLAAGHGPRFGDDSPLSKFVILARDDCRCFYCGNVPEKSKDAQLDHIVPVEAGGEHIAGNLVVACSGCNLRKQHSRLSEEANVLDEIARRNEAFGIRDDHIVDLPERVK